MGYFSLLSGIDGLLREYLIRWLYLKMGWHTKYAEKKLKSLCERELKKCFGTVKFDKVIYYYGSGLMNLKKLSYFRGEKICSLIDFDRTKFDKKYGYQTRIRNMVTKGVDFDVSCVNEEFTKTQLYQKTKDRVRYEVMDQNHMNIHGLMEVGD